MPQSPLDLALKIAASTDVADPEFGFEFLARVLTVALLMHRVRNKEPKEPRENDIRDAAACGVAASHNIFAEECRRYLPGSQTPSMLKAWHQRVFELAAQPDKIPVVANPGVPGGN